MKYGVYFAYWEQEWDTDYRSYIKKVAELGFDILEVGALGLINMTDDELKDLKKEAEKHNIILTAGIGLPKEYDVSSSDKNIREKGIAFMKDILNKLHIAGIYYIGGTIYSYWPVDYTEDINKATSRMHSINSMKTLADYAAKYKITLLVEVLNRFEQFLLNDTEEGIEYIKEINKPNVKLMLDTFHMNIEEDNIAEAIRKAGSYLGHFHIGEGNRKVPGKGSMPWNEIAQALKDINYTGNVVMEPFVKTGGTVGKDIKVWRDLSNNADTKQLDKDIKQSLQMIQKTFQ